MISGFSNNLLLQKHQPLQYSNQIQQQFQYFKQLKYVIDGLTQFIPQDRFYIKEALIILKGIICFEFKLDQKFFEVMQGSETQQFISNFKKDIEFVQDFDDRFYPIVQNEKLLLQEIQTKNDCDKQKYELKIVQLEQKLMQQEKIIQDLQEKLKEQSQNEKRLPQEFQIKSNNGSQKQVYQIQYQSMLKIYKFFLKKQ
ncbi:hypothetical protein ABPG72_014036, partial [Tetrahymena utriculariae]